MGTAGLMSSTVGSLFRTPEVLKGPGFLQGFYKGTLRV